MTVTAVYTYRESCKPLLGANVIVSLLQDVQVQDSQAGPQAFSIQVNLIGSQTWMQAVLEIKPGNCMFSTWQGLLGQENPSLCFSQSLPDLPLTAGTVFLLDVVDDGTSISAVFSLYNSPEHTTWLKFWTYDKPLVVSVPIVGYFAGSRATFTMGSFNTVLLTSPSVTDLTTLSMGYDGHGLPLPYTFPCGMTNLQQSQETSNLSVVVGNTGPNTLSLTYS